MRKKRIAALLLSACMACSLAACGKGTDGKDSTQTNEGTESVAQDVTETVTAERTQPPKVSSVDMGIDPKDYVTKLCAYKGIELTISGTYEMSGEEVSQVIMQDLEACGGNLMEVTDRDAVEKGDIVHVDYTGYLDGEAFDNGAATDQFLDVENNKDALMGNGFVDGFTEGLIGAKVGDTIRSKVTFPEDYSSEELAGKETEFEFVIHGIYYAQEDYDKIVESAKEEDAMVNQRVNNNYGSYGITNLQELIDYETDYITNTLENEKYSDTISALKDYMLENCEVEVPEEYLDARVTEYIISFENDNLDPDMALETYLANNYQVTVEEAKKTWRDYEESQIKSEFIFAVIAEKEGIEFDQDDFDTFVDGILSSSSASNLGFSEVEDIYKYYGAGNAGDGEVYMKNLFVMNKAIDYVYENLGEVTVKPEEESTEE